MDDGEGGDVFACLAVGFYVVDGDHGEVLADAREGPRDYVDEVGRVVLALLPVEDLHGAVGGIVICLYVGGESVRIKERNKRVYYGLV